VKEKLKHLLAERQKRRITDPNRIPAAVLLPLFVKDGQCHILFIKRTEMVKDHKGQISFPGGQREPGEALTDTALRECHEEIGVSPKDVEMLGELNDEITTTSSYIVTPFVGRIPWPYAFQKNDYEVDEIIEVPMAALLVEGCLRDDIEFLDGEEVASCAYHYQGRIIWGATARILNRFLEIYVRASEQVC
jgi:8-oxo-dGTP pyrophosphatase MutT (NUDIX family)